MPSPALPTAVQWAQSILSTRLQAGDTVVDATAGNGHDTLFLAGKVLPGGHVYALDVQEQAITATRQRLVEAGIDEAAYTLVHAGHETLGSRLPEALKGQVRAFMFNLGYLPGGSKSLITVLDSTMAALAQAVDWLAQDGVLTVIAYPGHDGGREEGAAVEQWMASLSTNEYEVQKIAFLNFRPTTPYCMVVRRRTWQPRNRQARTADPSGEGQGCRA